LANKAQQGTQAEFLLNKLLWLTRPLEQNASLETGLQQLGASTFCFPLLEISQLLPAGETLTRLQNLDRYDLVFYVSSNAANAGVNAIANWWPQYPSHLLNFAVGPATASVLEQYGLAVHYPLERMDSEAMLALPQLQDIAGKKALIVRGVGGREIMSEGLQARGASVDYAELYERKLPSYSAQYMKECLQRFPPHAIVISSSEAMDNLKTLFSGQHLPWQQLPLYVASERLAAHANTLGFAQVVTMAGATDEALIKGLCKAMDRQ